MEEDVLQHETAEKVGEAQICLISILTSIQWLRLERDLISSFMLVKETHLMLLLLRWPLLKYPSMAYLQGFESQPHLAFLPSVFMAKVGSDVTR